MDEIVKAARALSRAMVLAECKGADFSAVEREWESMTAALVVFDNVAPTDEKFLFKPQPAPLY